MSIQKLSARPLAALSLFWFLFLIWAQPACAIHFPTILELKQESYQPLIDWNGNKPVRHRYEQPQQFDPDSFATLVSLYAEGATWHEWDGGVDRKKTQKQFPGLEQQWILKGYGNEKGWLGSGLYQGKYFLVFQESPPGGLMTVTDALRLNPLSEIVKFLDTSSEWLHTACENKNPAQKAPKIQNVCFVAGNDGHWKIELQKTPGTALDIWLSESESSSLKEIRSALENIPDMGQSEYAQDLSQMLLGESQNFLVKVSERLPMVFNWPSWQLQSLKIGQVPSKDLVGYVNRSLAVGDSLPALRFVDQNKMQVNVDLFFSGKLHLRVRRGNG